MVVVESSDGWTSPPLDIDRGYSDRLLGMRTLRASGLILRTASVHTIGMKRSLSIVGVSAAGTVVGARVVPPGRVVWMRFARAYLEFCSGAGLPEVGSTLRVRPTLSVWPDDSSSAQPR